MKAGKERGTLRGPVNNAANGASHVAAVSPTFRSQAQLYFDKLLKPMSSPTQSRRQFLSTLAFALHPHAPSFSTPYKLNKLVLSASPDPTAFDSKSVDCPFVFHYAGLFYMTYIGFDGKGYQTGLASSHNLADWKKLACILPRDPNSPITRFNIAMNWIVRENNIWSKGELKKVKGQYLGAYHAYPNPGYEQGAAVVGLCWSTDLMHWQIDPPILHPDDGAEWERGGLYKPCLVEHKGTFYLFYNAKNAE